MTLFRDGLDGEGGYAYVDHAGDSLRVTVHHAGTDTWLSLGSATSDEGTEVAIHLELDDVPEFVSRLLEATVRGRRLDRGEEVV